jgi:hypothetical protein
MQGTSLVLVKEDVLKYAIPYSVYGSKLKLIIYQQYSLVFHNYMSHELDLINLMIHARARKI